MSTRKGAWAFVCESARQVEAWPAWKVYGDAPQGVTAGEWQRAHVTARRAWTVTGRVFVRTLEGIWVEQ